MCARIIVCNGHTEHYDYLPSYPPDKEQSSHAVYWRGGDEFIKIFGIRNL